MPPLLLFFFLLLNLFFLPLYQVLGYVFPEWKKPCLEVLRRKGTDGNNKASCVLDVGYFYDDFVMVSCLKIYG